MTETQKPSSLLEKASRLAVAAGALGILATGAYTFNERASHEDLDGNQIEVSAPHDIRDRPSSLANLDKTTEVHTFTAETGSDGQITGYQEGVAEVTTTELPKASAVELPSPDRFADHG